MTARQPLSPQSQQNTHDVNVYHHAANVPSLSEVAPINFNTGENNAWVQVSSSSLRQQDDTGRNILRPWYLIIKQGRRSRTVAAVRRKRCALGRALRTRVIQLRIMTIHVRIGINHTSIAWKQSNTITWAAFWPPLGCGCDRRLWICNAIIQRQTQATN